MPTCIPGDSLSADGLLCVPCPAGYYQHHEQSPWPCKQCELGTYSTAGSSSCSTCPAGHYRYPPVSKGATSCDGICICFDVLQEAALLAGIATVYALCWWQAGEARLAIAINMVLPMVDHTTDILYFVKTPFYSTLLCVLSLGCVMGPTVVFTYYLLNDEAYPGVYRPFSALILSQERGRPKLYGEHVKYSFEKHDSPAKFLWFLILWAILVVYQCLVLIATAIYLFFYPFFLLFWFLLGAFLFATRTVAVGKVRQLWYSVWTNNSNFFDDGVMGDIDTKVLNQCLFAAFVFETIPHFFVQVANNILIQNWSIFTAISAASSCYMVLAGLWQFVYYRYWMKIPLHEIPVNGVLPIGGEYMKWAEVKPCTGARHTRKREKKIREQQATAMDVEMGTMNSMRRVAEAFDSIFHLHRHSVAHPPATATVEDTEKFRLEQINKLCKTLFDLIQDRRSCKDFNVTNNIITNIINFIIRQI